MTMMKRLLIAVLALGFAVGVVWAQPSQYHVWKNNATGQTVCEEGDMGPGWTHVSGPYEDPSCKVLAQ
jgi:hypothetical protein